MGLFAFQMNSHMFPLPEGSRKKGIPPKKQEPPGVVPYRGRGGTPHGSSPKPPHSATFFPPVSATLFINHQKSQQNPPLGSNRNLSSEVPFQATATPYPRIFPFISISPPPSFQVFPIAFYPIFHKR